MKLYHVFLAVLGFVVVVRAETPTTLVSLTNAKNEHRLNLSFEMPTGWSIEWYPETSRNSIARVYRVEAAGKEAIVIAASTLGGIPPSDIFQHSEFKKLTALLHASVHQPEASIRWKGVYLDYPLPSQIKTTPYNIDVRNWFTTADGRLVQFQCYFFFDPLLTSEKQREVHKRVEMEYLAMLKSVKVGVNRAN